MYLCQIIRRREIKNGKGKKMFLPPLWMLKLCLFLQKKNRALELTVFRLPAACRGPIIHKLTSKGKVHVRYWGIPCISISQLYYWIDRITYFVHWNKKKMNQKSNPTLYESLLYKAEGFHKTVFGSVFKIHISMNKINYTVNYYTVLT